MKSFALHLVVVFIIGSQYHQIGYFCSSTPPASLPSKIRPEGDTAVVASVLAHDHIISSSSSSSSSSSVPSATVRTNIRRSLQVRNNSNNKNNNSTTKVLNDGAGTLHHQPRSYYHQISKTPRIIEYLLGGDLNYEVTDTPQKFLNNNDYTTNTQHSDNYFRRKSGHQDDQLKQKDNNSRDNKNVQSLSKQQNSKESDPSNSNNDSDNDDDGSDDSALLEDPKDLDNWDNGIWRSSAGAGKETITKPSKKKEDSKKTLADQVRDGKYGLIEKELFQKPPERPGIISYSPNKEVPADNAKTLGGLDEEDIWLAEDHLLVLKGGSLSDDNENQPWEPIDDYQAPNRQIKIPSNSKVPPPFPVQFEDNGPIQIIGNHKFSLISPYVNESLSAISSNGGYYTSETTNNDEKNSITGTRAIKNITNHKGGYFYPSPFPSWLLNNQTFVNPFLSTPETKNELGYKYTPSNNVDNSTDYIDEDDPSLYYPPPYDFVYESNYSSPVPPGPLVPGIVLPPPPNAFARLENKKPTTSYKEIPFRQILTKVSDNKLKKVTTTMMTTTTTQKPAITKLTTTTTPPTTTYVYPHARPEDFAFTKQIKKPDKVRVYTPTKQQYVPHTQYVTSSPPPQVVLPQTSPPEIVSFVPKEQPVIGTSGKGQPIYYEYFDARNAVPNNQPAYYNDYISTTPAPIPQQSLSQISQPLLQHIPKLRPYEKITTIRPVSSPRLSKNYLPTRPPFNYDNYLYITPKPEIRPNGVPDNYITYRPSKPAFKKPIYDFNHEVNAIRQTLQYYNSQQIQQNIIPKTPKPKAVYEYSFDATKSNRNFQPPSQIDTEPFKPMVKYSPSIDDENAFKAMAYVNPSKSDEVPTVSPQTEQDYYITTSTTPKTRLKSDKSYIPPAGMYSTIPSKPEHTTNEIQYTTTRTKPNPQDSPWISIEKQIVHEIIPQTTRLTSNVNSDAGGTSKHRASAGYSRDFNPSIAKHPFNGYQYRPTPVPRPNNRYYQIGPTDPFSRQINAIKAQLRPFTIHEVSLENDTYVNFAPNRPPINPDAEFIRPQPLRQDYYQNQQQHQQHQPHPTPFPIAVISPTQRLIKNRIGSGYRPVVSLEDDTLVNYRQPLPSINPDSEFIQQPSPPQQQERHHQQIFSRSPALSNQYRSPSTTNLQYSRLPPLQQNYQQSNRGLYYFPPPIPPLSSSHEIRHRNRNY